MCEVSECLTYTSYMYAYLQYRYHAYARTHKSYYYPTKTRLDSRRSRLAQLSPYLAYIRTSIGASTQSLATYQTAVSRPEKHVLDSISSLSSLHLLEIQRTSIQRPNQRINKLIS
jgi:hypothetical protein